MSVTRVPAPDKKVAFHTLGCRLNFSESGSIAQEFAKRGYQIVPFGEQADVTFLNTCTVTDGADSSCRNTIRKAHRTSPEGKVVVAGCYAQMEAETIKNMTGVDLILGTSEKYKVFEYLDETSEQVVKIDKTNHFWGATTTPEDSHTRAFLKIQDGCNYVCSFCIIPQARGRSRTISIEDAISDAKKLIADGFQEIILTGVNVGEYESTSGERLEELVEQLLRLPGLKRLRLASVEPNTITEDLLRILKDSGKYQDHFHIPLQSGNDEVLTSMRRKYTVAQYKEMINLVKEYFPEAAIGGDVIVGYPGETEEMFLDTYKLLEQLPHTHFHVFPYAKRKNTLAARMEDQIQHDVKKDRVKRLIELGDRKAASLAEGLIGREFEVLFETRKAGKWAGYIPQFLKCFVETDEDLKNQIRTVRITSSSGDQLFAELV